mgnify:CR=1 FL=1|jgi:very-short-patch-repair endonuclease
MTIPLRILLTIGCVLIGFLFPLMFLLAIGIGWSIYNDLANPPDKITGVRPLKPDLMTRERMHDLCESPAETAFLDAMLDAFDLEPSDDALVGGGIRLRSQVEVLRYRLDFLVDERLVVEIDGALWHSSPEAVERDRIRDLDLQGEGYFICRIPAKVVLYRPRDAIAQVKAARAALPENIPLPETKRIAEGASPPEPIGVRNVLGRMAKAADDFHDTMVRMDAYHQIDSCLTGRFSTMELIVEKSCEMTVRSIQTYEDMGRAPGEAKVKDLFLRNIMKLSEALSKSLKERQEFSGKLDELRKNVLTEDGRAYCENRIETVVDEHLKKIAKWHATVFPNQTVFKGGRLTARNDIIRQLRAICFDGADPADYVNQYYPPEDFNASDSSLPTP